MQNNLIEETQKEFIGLLISRQLEIEEFFRKSTIPKAPFMANLVHSLKNYIEPHDSNIQADNTYPELEEDFTKVNFLKELDNLSDSLERNVREYKKNMSPEEKLYTSPHEKEYNARLIKSIDKIKRNMSYLVADKQEKDKKFKEMTFEMIERLNLLEIDRKNLEKSNKELKDYNANLLKEIDNKNKEILFCQDQIKEFNETLENEKTSNQGLQTHTAKLEHNIIELEERIELYQRNCDKITLDNDKIVKAIKNKKFKLKNNKEYLKLKENEIISLQQKQIEMKDIQTQLQEELEALKEMKANLENKNNELTQENQNLEEAKSELAEIKHLLEDSERSIEAKQQNFSELELNHAKLQASYELMLNKVKNKPEINSKSIPYDILINIDSLLNKKYGWKIQESESFHQLNNPLEKNYTSIGFLGRENIGKTFLLNKICGLNLPLETNTNIQGLSIKYSDNFLCLDSVGLQTPVYYYDEKLMERFGMNSEELIKNEDLRYKMIKDRTLTDLFIQDFILDVCQIIVIVVGQLTQNDQKFIERISKRYKHKKKIIVLHNFSNLYSIEDVTNRIEKDILCIFPVKTSKIPETDLLQFIGEQEKGKKQFGDLMDDKINNIIHLVIGMDWGESGKHFNARTFDYIRKIIDNDKEKMKFNLKEELQVFFQENFRNYLKFTNSPKKPLTLEMDQKEENSLKIVYGEEFEVSNPMFNSLGSLMPHAFDLIEQKNQYICLVEISDLIKESIELELDSKKEDISILLIKGQKKTNENNEAIVGNRSHGAVFCQIPLGPRNAIKNIDEKNWKYEDGVLIVEVEKYQEEDEK